MTRSLGALQTHLPLQVACVLEPRLTRHAAMSRFPYNLLAQRIKCVTEIWLTNHSKHQTSQSLFPMVISTELSSKAVAAVARNSFCVLLLRSKFSFSAEASACLYRLDDYPFITMRFHSATRRRFIDEHQSILLDGPLLLLSLYSSCERSWVA